MIGTSIPFEEYRAIDAVNWSTLRLLDQSWAHYLAAKSDARSRADTAATRFGRALHCAVLEPGRFRTAYKVWPTSAGRRAGSRYDAFVADRPDCEIISEAERDTIDAMVHSVSQHPLAPQLLASGAAEHTVVWHDPVTQILCKARLDFITGDNDIIDLKTVRRSDEHSFTRVVTNYVYDGQAAFYSAGVRVLTRSNPRFLFLAIEKEPPYDVALFSLNYESMITSQRRVDELLRRLQAGPPSCPFKGRSGQIQIIEALRYATGNGWDWERDTEGLGNDGMR